MLDSFIAVAYANETKKTAEATLMAKLRTMPDAVVEKIAFGGMPCEAKGGIGDPKTWLDMFQGSPLFDQALELERADLQLEQADIEQRMNNQAQDTWTKRDALRLKKRMLELDLAVQNAGGAAEPEVKEEEGVQLLEQAQAEETAAGEGNEPHEKKEDAAIDQFRAAQAEEAAAKPKAPPKPKAEAAPPVEGPPAEDKKAAEIKVAAAAAAGRLMAKLAEPPPPKGVTAKEWDKQLQKTAVEVPAAALLGGALGARKAHETDHGLGGGALRGAIGAEGGSTLGATGGATLGGLAGHALARKLKMDSTTGENTGRLVGGLSGALAGGVGGYKALTRHMKKKEAGVGGALMGAATGAKNLIGTAYKAGGLGQVAKSVGSVATGFAKANPLAAAGAAGVAGLAAGRLSKSNAPQG